MKKILVHRDKHDNIYYDASTPELKASAYLKIFRNMDRDGWYDFDTVDMKALQYDRKVQDDHDAPDEVRKEAAVRVLRAEEELRFIEVQRQLYKLAKKGVASAAEHLIQRRCDYEYERVTLEEVY